MTARIARRGFSIRLAPYSTAFAMSVPPPSCTFSSSSTGSATSAVRSITCVSNAIRWVLRPGRCHRHAAGDPRVDDGADHRPGLVDEEDELPLVEVTPDAGEELGVLDENPAFLRLVVRQVRPDRPAEVEVTGLPERTRPPRPRAGE